MAHKFVAATGESWEPDRVEDLLAWARGHVEVVEAALHKDRAWGTTFRLTTSSATVWAKAVADPKRRFEAALTATLAAVAPGLGPDVLASEAERSWLLLADHGTPIDEALPRAAQEAAVEGLLPALVAAQRALAPDVDRWLAAGVPDRRVERLPSLLDGFLERSPHRVACEPLLPRFAEVCAELAATPVPGTVDHADLHGSNVLWDGRAARLIDWGDACVTHPFTALAVTFQLVTGGASPRLRDTYLDAWGGGVEHRRTFDLATWVAPIVRVLSLAEEDDGEGEIVELLAAWADSPH